MINLARLKKEARNTGLIRLEGSVKQYYSYFDGSNYN